ncbi:outer surface protein [Fictibacillus macauensis ZFHKF-1]|uniref:Outer surface protein n=1 Tax=Fictibacillus macauensis ZFHKF-1 TaxID=1196324 RepID=I8UHR2_9BACL|nr:MupG family TIM beta-alpha barrel fold protein [Fictibacillus macauensis]EIT86368.1 outer surface protein [Fictibacillus macauensis ZFHKF-1]
MRKLGISIYPEVSTPKDDLAYITLAHRYGFSKLFTCLLSAEGKKEEIIARFKEVIGYAKQLGMDVVLDISPRVFTKLDISYNDLSFFADLGATGIRLDLGFSGREEALMTHNDHELDIEINMSNNTRYLDNIMSYQPNRERLTGSHNFYPHRYSGLSEAHFYECCQNFRKHNIRTACFISSQAATFGPWEITEGLCTLERHRTLPLLVQAKHLVATGLIDDLLIGNAYASEAELQSLAALDQKSLTLTVQLDQHITALEKKIVLQERHVYRGDVSDYLIRSTQSRVTYKAFDFPAINTKPIQRGDILIDNNGYGQYKGELQIALQDMENSGNTNVVGHIVEEELFLLHHLKPWDTFQFETIKE